MKEFISLTDICSPKQWKTISGKDMLSSGYPVYGANGVIGYYGEYNHSDPVITIACRGTCGKVGITAPQSYVNGNAMCLDSLDKGYDINFIYYYLKNYDFRDAITGTSIPQITRASLKNVRIPVLSLETQRKIIEKLRRIDKVITKKNSQIVLLDNLVKARFVEMFGHLKYPRVPISDLIMGRVSSAKKDFDKNDTILYIDISAIDNRRNIMTEYTEYIFKDAPSRAQQHIKFGDIVISTVRPNLKNIAITTFNEENLVASSGFCVLRPNEKCTTDFLMANVISDDFTNSMIKVVSGANYPAIKDSDVLNYEISLPPIQLQKEFSKFCSQVDKSKLLYAINLRWETFTLV